MSTERGKREDKDGEERREVEKWRTIIHSEGEVRDSFTICYYEAI